jgi:hypothetical protein
MKPQSVGGKWRKPIVSGRQRSQLQGYFETAGVPWIYSEARPEVHATSTYNRKPKGTKFSNNYETRLALIRRNLSQQPDRMLKLRTEHRDTKPMVESEKIFHGVLKALNAELASSKFSSKGGSRKAASDDIVEKRKGSPVKKQLGTSKGGQLGKKEREVMGMAQDLVSGKKAEEDE